MTTHTNQLLRIHITLIDGTRTYESYLHVHGSHPLMKVVEPGAEGKILPYRVFRTHLVDQADMDALVADVATQLPGFEPRHVAVKLLRGQSIGSIVQGILAEEVNVQMLSDIVTRATRAMAEGQVLQAAQGVPEEDQRVLIAVNDLSALIVGHYSTVTGRLLSDVSALIGDPAAPRTRCGKCPACLAN
jgi:hypothetical protein